MENARHPKKRYVCSLRQLRRGANHHGGTYDCTNRGPSSSNCTTGRPLARSLPVPIILLPQHVDAEGRRTILVFRWMSYGFLSQRQPPRIIPDCPFNPCPCKSMRLGLRRAPKRRVGTSELPWKPSPFNLGAFRREIYIHTDAVLRPPSFISSYILRRILHRATSKLRMNSPVSSE